MISSGCILKRIEIFISMYLSQHHILIIFIEFILFCSLSSVAVLHILKSLSLEKDINLVLFDLHDVRTLAVYQNYRIAKLYLVYSLHLHSEASVRSISKSLKIEQSRSNLIITSISQVLLSPYRPQLMFMLFWSKYLRGLADD